MYDAIDYKNEFNKRTAFVMYNQWMQRWQLITTL